MYIDALTRFIGDFTPFAHTREVVAGAFFMFDVIIVGVFILYVIQNYEVQTRTVIRGAFGLMLHFFGQLLVRYWAWTDIKFRSDGGTTIADVGGFPIYLAGSFLSFMGLILTIQILTPPQYRPWHWVVGIPLAVAVLWFTRVG